MITKRHSRTQSARRTRKRPGTGGQGDHYRIEVRPKHEFTLFRTQDVGDKGHLQRIAGKRGRGSWDTQTWLVEKRDAHVTKSGQLTIDNIRARAVLRQIRGPITHVEGDVFRAKPRHNIPERKKPTPAQKKARRENIKKAQAARWQ